MGIWLLDGRQKKSVLQIVLILVLILLQTACGTENIASSYTPLTKEEKAKEALKNEDFELAIKLFQAAIKDEPDNYALFRYLAAAQAGLAGFKVYDAIADQFTGDDQNADLMVSLSQSLPADPSSKQLDLLSQAIDTLLLIPEAERDPSNSKKNEFAKTIATQISIYQSAYSIMYLNRFNQKLDDGSIDRQRLESMTDEDAEAIIASLQAVAESAEDPALANDVTKILQEIEAKEGASQRDKLIRYLEENS